MVIKKPQVISVSMNFWSDDNSDKIKYTDDDGTD